MEGDLCVHDSHGRVVVLGALQASRSRIGPCSCCFYRRRVRPTAASGGSPAAWGLSIADYPRRAGAVPGLLLSRFNLLLIFFERSVLSSARSRGPGNRAVTWLIVDGAPLVHLDSTGAEVDFPAGGPRASRRAPPAWRHDPWVGQTVECSGTLDWLGADAASPSLLPPPPACQIVVAAAAAPPSILSSRKKAHSDS